jgi:hypothetical protein
MVIFLRANDVSNPRQLIWQIKPDTFNGHDKHVYPIGLPRMYATLWRFGLLDISIIRQAALRRPARSCIDDLLQRGRA